MTAPDWECPHCEAMNVDNGKPVQYCGACGRRWDDMPEKEFDQWMRNSVLPPRNEPGGPL